MKDKQIPIKQIDDKVTLLALDDEIPEHQIFLKCGKEGCKDKVVMQVSMPDTIKGLKVDKLYPVCRKHLEELYKQDFFDELKDINHLKMVEGIIKYGSMQEWLKNERN